MTPLQEADIEDLAAALCEEFDYYDPIALAQNLNPITGVTRAVAKALHHYASQHAEDPENVLELIIVTWLSLEGQ